MSTLFLVTPLWCLFFPLVLGYLGNMFRSQLRRTRPSKIPPFKSGEGRKISCTYSFVYFIGYQKFCLSDTYLSGLSTLSPTLPSLPPKNNNNNKQTSSDMSWAVKWLSCVVWWVLFRSNMDVKCEVECQVNFCPLRELWIPVLPSNSQIVFCLLRQVCGWTLCKIQVEQ